MLCLEPSEELFAKKNSALSQRRAICLAEEANAKVLALAALKSIISSQRGRGHDPSE